MKHMISVVTPLFSAIITVFVDVLPSYARSCPIRMTSIRHILVVLRRGLILWTSVLSCGPGINTYTEQRYPVPSATKKSN